jgi:hypothetical protein
MPVLTLQIPKSVTTNNFDASLTAGTAVEVDTGVEESTFIPIRLGSINPPTFTVANAVTTNGSATVTTTGNGFLYVRVGDPVAGTGIAGGSTVAAKASNNSITLSANATASGTVTLTFDPPAVTPTVFAIKVLYRSSSANFTVVPIIYVFDGTNPGTVTESNAIATYPLITADKSPISVDFSNYLTNLRYFPTP